MKRWMTAAALLTACGLSLGADAQDDFPGLAVGAFGDETPSLVYDRRTGGLLMEFAEAAVFSQYPLLVVQSLPQSLDPAWVSPAFEQESLFFQGDQEVLFGQPNVPFEGRAIGLGNSGYAPAEMDETFVRQNFAGGLADFFENVLVADLIVAESSSFAADAGGPYTITEGRGFALDASGTAVPGGAAPLYQSFAWDFDGEPGFDEQSESPMLELGSSFVSQNFPVVNDQPTQYTLALEVTYLLPPAAGATVPQLWVSDLVTATLTVRPFIDLVGDTDGDGDIDDADLGTAFANYTGAITNPTRGTPRKTEAQGNTDGDFDVDDADLGTLFSNYTGALTPSTAAVPEPASLALLGLGGVALSRRRHRSSTIGEPSRGQLLAQPGDGVFAGS